MYKSLRYLKVGGRYIEKGKTVELSGLSEQEITSLKKKGFIKQVEGNEVLTSVEKKEVDIVPVAEIENDSDDIMTDEEIKAELLEKITHTVAVRELKLLGAEFKANASLETLVGLIMENEVYENHFFDYIENNEL